MRYAILGPFWGRELTEREYKLLTAVDAGDPGPLVYACGDCSTEDTTVCHVAKGFDDDDSYVVIALAATAAAFAARREG